MAGIYLHIPFCKQACHYCDFHFSTNLSRKAELVKAIGKELELRQKELEDESIHTIYFGGGTPSLLSAAELEQLLTAIHRHFRVVNDPEITLEANPDDLNPGKLADLKTTGVNRLSIGIQSFDERRLKYIHRAHTSLEARKCLEMSLDAGFRNLSADLIYAIPPEDMASWEQDLEEMLSYDLVHLSLYGLTIEEKTVFGNWAKRGKLHEVSEEMAARQYQLAIERLTAAGYEHYEVSNFAKPGWYSRHNSAYWDDQKYLGVGPGAHSYNGKDRSFNISNNAKYLSTLQKEELAITWEFLTDIDRLNEYLFTHLRTKRGVSLTHISNRFGKNLLADYQRTIEKYLVEGLARKEKDRLALTSKGFMLADEISARFFYDE